jgi:hypothetical protein
VITGRAHTMSAETFGTWAVVTPKPTKGGQCLPLSSDGQTMVLSVSLHPPGHPPLAKVLNLYGILGTILGYIFYWIVVMVVVFMLRRRGKMKTFDDCMLNVER